jgi:protein ImuA
MALASHPTAIAELRRTLERMESHGGSARGVLPFGVPEIDTPLPGGGLPLGHLHEILEGGFASAYGGLATLFASGILARLSGPVLWCLRGRDLFAPALSRVGLHPDRLIFCETWKDGEVLPAMEEGLRCKGLAGVVGELVSLPLKASRRLQLAAAESGVTALAVHRWQAKRADEPNAAATRWRVSPHPSPAEGFEGMPRQHWNIELLRVRGGEPHNWIVEAPNAAGYLALPAVPAERSAATAGPRRALAG